MKFLTKFLAWRESVNRRLKADRFASGYESATSWLLAGEYTPEALYALTEESQAFGDYSEYDAGVRAAIYDFEHEAVEPLATGPRYGSSIVRTIPTVTVCVQIIWRRHGWTPADRGKQHLEFLRLNAPAALPVFVDIEPPAELDDASFLDLLEARAKARHSDMTTDEELARLWKMLEYRVPPPSVRRRYYYGCEMDHITKARAAARVKATNWLTQ